MNTGTSVDAGRSVEGAGVSLFLRESGPASGPCVVLCHGFPETGLSWHHQLAALPGHGLRVLAPDQRGFGRSDVPDGVDDYAMSRLVQDVARLVEDSGSDDVLVVGHDWGAGVAWSVAATIGDRLRGVMGISSPFRPRLDTPPSYPSPDGTTPYTAYFQQPGVADQELDADPADSLLRIMHTLSAQGSAAGRWSPDLPVGAGFLDGMVTPAQWPTWLDHDVFDDTVSAFARTGFTGGLNWYRNMGANWRSAASATREQLTVPCVYATGQLDPLNAWPPLADAVRIFPDWVRDLRRKAVVPGSGHWVQQEQPHAVTRLIVELARSTGMIE